MVSLSPFQYPPHAPQPSHRPRPKTRYLVKLHSFVENFVLQILFQPYIMNFQPLALIITRTGEYLIYCLSHQLFTEHTSVRNASWVAKKDGWETHDFCWLLAFGNQKSSISTPPLEAQGPVSWLVAKYRWKIWKRTLLTFDVEFTTFFQPEIDLL